MNRTLRIGLSANASGPHTRELTQAFADASQWLNRKAEFIWAEDGRDPTMAARAAVQLANANVAIVVGHLSAAAALAALPVYVERNIAFIAPATSHKRLNPSGWRGALRAFGTDTRTARTMVTVCPPGAQPVVAFQHQTYGTALAQELEAVILGRGEVPRLIGCSLPLTARALPAQTTTLYVAGIHEFCIEVVRDARGQGFGGPIVVGDDCFTPNFVNLCGTVAEGTLVATQIVASRYGFQQDDIGSVIEATDIDGYHSTSLIALTVALQAVAQYPDLRGAELGHVIQQTSWATSYGTFGFNPQGDLVGLDDVAFEVRGGRLLLKHFEVAASAGLSA
jgi:branched-chain amino acid transport system substrate-binding protein